MALLSTGCGEQDVASAESESEANQMFDILHSKGFQVDKKNPEGEEKVWRIVINEGWFGEGEAATAIQVLRDYGLPRATEPEAKADGSFGIPSEREEKKKQIRELQLNLERQLYTLPDVIRASVIVAQPEDDTFELEKTPPTASVSLVLKEAKPRFSIDTVQKLIAGGVSNLQPEKVRVAVIQQTLRELPLEKIQERRRSNMILTVGIGVISLLALVLGGVLYFSKKRRKLSDDMNPQLISETEDTAEDFDETVDFDQKMLNVTNQE